LWEDDMREDCMWLYIYIYQISMAAGAYRPRRFAEYSADSEKVVVPILWCLGN